MLALLGWNPGDDREIMSMERMIEAFDLKDVHKSGADLILSKRDGLITFIYKKKEISN